ncbi:MAG: hypothetical protein NVSMB9_33160 [Isosphaeraceae bacterium]
MAACSTLYFWPKVHRERDPNGKVGILHVKCVVADGRWLFLSSANLTEYAFSINMELGVLITGGEHPRIVERQFEQLIVDGLLDEVSPDKRAGSCNQTLDFLHVNGRAAIDARRMDQPPNPG